EAKVAAKFGTGFGKAELDLGPCPGDQVSCNNLSDTCESTVVAAMTDTFPSKCEAAKRKAAAKLAKGELGCYAKAAAKGLALDPACILKAQGKSTTALGKAGACPDGGSPQSLVETTCLAVLVTTDSGGLVNSMCAGVAATTTTTSTTTTSSTTSTT